MTAPEEPQSRPLPVARSWADTPTLWQRFWRSPWTWLVFAIGQSFALGGHQSGWSQLAHWGLFILFLVNFLQKANARWGKP